MLCFGVQHSYRASEPKDPSRDPWKMAAFGFEPRGLLAGRFSAFTTRLPPQSYSTPKLAYDVTPSPPAVSAASLYDDCMACTVLYDFEPLGLLTGSLQYIGAWLAVQYCNLTSKLTGHHGLACSEYIKACLHNPHARHRLCHQDPTAWEPLQLVGQLG